MQLKNTDIFNKSKIDLNGVRIIAPEENCPLPPPPPRLGLGFGLGLESGLGAILLGGNCPRTDLNTLKRSN